MQLDGRASGGCDGKWLKTGGWESGPSFASLRPQIREGHLIVVILCIAVLGLFVISLTGSLFNRRQGS
jgi:hypothetical protein